MWFTVKLIAQLIEGGSLTRNDCTEVLNVIDLKMGEKKRLWRSFMINVSLNKCPPSTFLVCSVH